MESIVFSFDYIFNEFFFYQLVIVSYDPVMEG